MRYTILALAKTENKARPPKIKRPEVGDPATSLLILLLKARLTPLFGLEEKAPSEF